MCSLERFANRRLTRLNGPRGRGSRQHLQAGHRRVHGSSLFRSNAERQADRLGAAKVEAKRDEQNEG